jgi:hypothetical protein
VLLIVGAYYSLRGRQPRIANLLIWAGCFCLTAMVLYQIISLLHDAADPLVVKPTLGLFAIYLTAAMLTLLADAAAIRLTWKTN